MFCLLIKSPLPVVLLFYQKYKQLEKYVLLLFISVGFGVNRILVESYLMFLFTPDQAEL